MMKKIAGFITVLIFSFTFILPKNLLIKAYALGASGYFSELSINKTEFFIGEDLQIKIKLNSTKKANVSMRYLIGFPYTMDFTLQYNEATGCYEGNYKINDTFRGGIWEPESISINYGDGTSATIFNTSLNMTDDRYSYEDLSPLQFNLLSGDVDLQAFTNNFNISADAAVVYTNDVVNYTIATDNPNLISSGKIRFKNISDNSFYSVDLIKDDTSIKAKLPITALLSNGTYSIADVNVQLDNGQALTINNSGVSQGEYTKYFDCDVRVTNMDIDLNTLKISPSVVNPNSWVKLTAKATRYKGTKMEPVTVSFSNLYPPIDVLLYPSADGQTYEGKTFVTDKYSSGKYIPSQFHEGEGMNLFCKDISGMTGLPTFTVPASTEDKTPPLLTSISINKNNFVQGDKLALTAKASDDQSGVSRIVVSYLDFDVELTNVNGTFYGERTFDRFDFPNTYPRPSIKVFDNAGNIAYAPYEMGANLAYTLSNNPSLPAPSLSSIKINKNSFNRGEKVVFTAVMQNYSKYKTVDVVVESQTFKTAYNVSLKYSNGVYVGELFLDNYMDSGKWMVKEVSHMIDSVWGISIYDLRYKGYTANPKADFSNCSFTLNGSDTKGYYLINSTEACLLSDLSNITINGDLYIRPNCPVTISGNVQINGNLYVGGVLYNKGNLKVTGTIYAQNRVTREPEVNECGLFIDKGGTIGTSKITIGNSLIPNKLALNISNNILVEDEGTVYLSCHTLPGFEVSVDGRPITVAVDGSFSTDETITESLGNREEVSLTIKDWFGNSRTIKLKVINSKFDVNKDRGLDIMDLAALSRDYGGNYESSDYNYLSDLNLDGYIDIYDIAALSKEM